MIRYFYLCYLKGFNLFQDVEQLHHELPHAVYKYLVPLEKFNHLDFLWAIDIRELLYDRVLEIMSRY